MDNGTNAIMTTNRFRTECEPTRAHYTDLFASISEEDGSFTVQVRLYDQAKPGSGAWGEETADSIEAASVWVGALAAEFSIPQARIKIEIRMNNMTSGTRH